MAASSAINPKLRLLNMLNEGKTAMATFTILKGVRAAQVVAHTGLDAVMIDCEHGNIDDSDMHDMVATVAASGVSPAVRIRGLTFPLIKRALDTGAHGILVPMINTAADARSIVSFAKFPPVGIRGQGSPFACFSFGYATPAEYVAKANESLVLMVQIETAEGLRNVEEICRVDGIDVLVIGPNDLALALLGYAPAKWTEPVYLEAIDTIVSAAKRHGKKAGIVVVDGDAAQKARERFDLVILSADVRALQGWYRKELQVARS